MSGTPETDDIARGNHVVPTEWAQQLERERDEAIDAMKRAMDAYAKACKAVDDWRSLQRATKK